MNIIFSYSLYIYMLSMLFLLFEEYLNWSLIMSFMISLLFSTKLFPYMGFPMQSFLFMWPIRYSVPLSETSWEKNPMKFYKISSYMILLMQSMVCISVFIMSTYFMMLD